MPDNVMTAISKTAIPEPAIPEPGICETSHQLLIAHP